MEALANRMKNNYEFASRHYLTRRTPVIVRVDGRAFHTLTRRCGKPFDTSIMYSMLSAAMQTSNRIEGFKLGYVQSDEASFLLTDFDTLQTEAWFGYCQNKIESIVAAEMSTYFSSHENHGIRAVFDARAFNIPVEEISNYFLWRALDWERNSVQMACQAHFSHKQLHGKGKAAQHEMLHSIGINWATDYSEMERNGTYITRQTSTSSVLPVFTQIEALVQQELRIPDKV